MAEPSPLASVNFVDPSKVNLYGARDQDTEEYKKALQDSLSALEQRYAQPNWFKVAAGFAKPQLGGFIASLGNANEAMAENLENQRTSELPIAQLRAQLALSKISMGQNQDAAQKFSEWKKTGEPMDEDTYAEIAGLAPNSASAIAAKSALDAEKTNQTLRVSQNQLLTSVITNKRNILNDQKINGQITAEEYNQGIADLKSLQEKLTPIIAPTGTKNTAKNPRLKDTDQGDGKSTDQSDVPASSASPTAFKTATGANKNLPETSAPSFLPEAGQFEPGRPDFTNFKIQNRFAIPHNGPDSLLTQNERQANAAVIGTAKAVEEQPANQYKQLQIINSPTTLGVVKGALDGADQAIKKNPDMVDDITNQVRKLGPAATMAQAGVVVSLYGNAASISIPVEAGAKGALSPVLQNYQDAFTNNLATLSYYSLLARGISPESAGAEKFKQLLLQETGILQGPQAIAHQIEMNKIHIEHAQNLYGAINKALPRALESGTPAPFHAIQEQHPLVEAENRVYQRLIQEQNSNWEETMKKAREREKARRP
jgi:hypothetical protein